MEVNCYEILGLNPGAEDIVIRAAYRALMQRYHPDKNPNTPVSSERFEAILQAYHTLSDPVRRALYDANLHESDVKIIGFYRSPHSFANLDLRAWQILLQIGPEYVTNLHLRNTNDQHRIKTYRSFLLELISEKLVSRLVQSVCSQTDDFVTAQALNNRQTEIRSLH